MRAHNVWRFHTLGLTRHLRDLHVRGGQPAAMAQELDRALCRLFVQALQLLGADAPDVSRLRYPRFVKAGLSSRLSAVRDTTDRARTVTSNVDQRCCRLLLNAFAKVGRDVAAPAQVLSILRQHPNPLLRRRAAGALRHMKPTQWSASALGLAALTDESLSVQRAAVEALSGAGAFAVPYLLVLLADRTFRWPLSPTALESLNALGRDGVSAIAELKRLRDTSAARVDQDRLEQVIEKLRASESH